MWHLCEETVAKNAKADWQKALLQYCRKLVQEYTTQQEEVEKWYQVCKVQFPVYLKYWGKHKHVTNSKPIVQEEIFNVPYTLPSGRTVYLKGKWDSVDVVGKSQRARLWLQENKSKGEIIEHQIQAQLQFDLQTMVYLIALEEAQISKHKIAGVRYNVVRRPLSGGKGSIRQLKPTKKNPAGESLPEYYARLRDDYIAKELEYFFMRWQCDISDDCFVKFKEEFLNPCLENLCDDFEWWTERGKIRINHYDYIERAELFPEHRRRHYRLPFGIYNVLAEGGATEYDEYLANGNRVGLQRTDDLFPELRELT
jgi:hypothetical protein